MHGGNDRVEEYLRRAAEAEARAAKIVDRDLREGFLKIAEDYRRMAGQTDRLEGRRLPDR
jgi:hypothetical protein